MSSKDKKARRVALRDFLIAIPGTLDRATASLGWLVVLAGISVAALVLHLAFGRGAPRPMPPPGAHGDNPSGALYVRDLGRLSDGRHTFDLVYELVLRNDGDERLSVGYRDQLAIGDVTGVGDVIELGHAQEALGDPATKVAFGITWRVALNGPADGGGTSGNYAPGSWWPHAAHFRIKAQPDQIADVAIGYHLEPQPQGWFNRRVPTRSGMHDEEVQLGAVLRAHCALGVKVQNGEMKSLCGS